MSGSRNFTLRLTAADQARLERLVVRWGIDRTAALRRLLSQQPASLTEGCFVALSRTGRGPSFLVRLRQEEER